ncbi:unnamed protein product, partial [Allacma fusca]
MQKAITIARQFEAVKKQQDELHNPQVHRLNTRPKQSNRNSIQQQNSKTPDKHTKDVDCKKCSKKGHFAKVYTSKSASVAVNQVDSTTKNNAFLGSLTSDKRNDTPWEAVVNIGHILVTFLLDSGADVTSNTVHSKVYVVRGLDRALLSRSNCKELQLLTRLFQASCSVSLTKVNPELEFPGIFDGLGELPKEYRIKLKPDAKPYAVHIPRRVPIALMDKLKAQLDQMESDGIIEKVDEPSEWCAPMVIVMKPNGDILPCEDLTKLNACIEREPHPMSSVDHQLAQIPLDAKVFSKVDQKCFEDKKKLIVSSDVLLRFDPNRPTIVSADASSYGLGCVLKQEDANENWRPVAFASRTMTTTERNYAQIEKEALATTWACERFEEFIL